jgi:hypothetical protein
LPCHVFGFSLPSPQWFLVLETSNPERSRSLYSKHNLAFPAGFPKIHFLPFKFNLSLGKFSLIAFRDLLPPADPPKLCHVSWLQINPKNMAITVALPRGAL